MSEPAVKSFCPPCISSSPKALNDPNCVNGGVLNWRFVCLQSNTRRWRSTETPLMILGFFETVKAPTRPLQFSVYPKTPQLKRCLRNCRYCLWLCSEGSSYGLSSCAWSCKSVQTLASWSIYLSNSLTTILSCPVKCSNKSTPATLPVGNEREAKFIGTTSPTPGSASQ